MIPPADQLRWVRRELASRQRWIAEGIRGGHSTESCTRFAEDLLVLEALEQTLMRERQLDWLAPGLQNNDIHCLLQ